MMVPLKSVVQARYWSWSALLVPSSKTLNPPSTCSAAIASHLFVDSSVYVPLPFKFFGLLLSVFFESLRCVCLHQFVSALIALPVLALLLRFLGVSESMAWRND